MFGQTQVKQLFQMSNLEAVDKAVAKLWEFVECPKARAYAGVPSSYGAICWAGESRI